MTENSIDGKLSIGMYYNSNEFEESKEEILSNDAYRLQLKEVFDYCALAKPDSLGFFEFCEALKHLSIKLSDLVISQTYWKRIEMSKNLSRKEINFDEFCILCEELKEFSLQNKKFSIDYNVMAFKGDGNFVMMQEKELKYVETQSEDDLVNLFMKRIEKGYGLNPEINIRVLEELESSSDYHRKNIIERRTGLKDFWEFINKCHIYRKEKEQNIPKLLVDPVNGINSLINLQQEDKKSSVSRIFDHSIVENDERTKGIIFKWIYMLLFFFLEGHII